MEVHLQGLVFAASLLLLCVAFVAPGVSAETIAEQTVKFSTPDGGLIQGDLYGKSDRCVVLAHGGQFNRQSWKPQAQQLVSAGFCVLAIDFRGYGDSHGPGENQPMTAALYYDVLGAVRYLQKLRSAKSVSVIGGSMGGTAAARASMESDDGEIDRLVLLSSILDNDVPDKLKGRKLFIVARRDTRGDGVVRLDEIKEQFRIAPEPKELLVLEGPAHAQHLFETDQAERLIEEILTFLTNP